MGGVGGGGGAAPAIRREPPGSYGDYITQPRGRGGAVTTNGVSSRHEDRGKSTARVLYTVVTGFTARRACQSSNLVRFVGSFSFICSDFSPKRELFLL